MPTSLLALLGFIAWTLFLLVLMEAIRSGLVLTGAVPANDFNPGNSNLSPFMQRLARAHANCLEGLPIFGGLLLIAVVAVGVILASVANKRREVQRLRDEQAAQRG